MYLRKVNILVLLMIFTLSIHAQLKLPNILSDNMVLQQNSTVRLWGDAVPNSTVSISVTWMRKTIKAKTDTNGKWEAKIRTIEASGPYSISISNVKEKKNLKNILLGEVWICAGQSNMEMPLKGFNSQPVNGALDAIMEAGEYSKIRMFTAQKSKAKDKQQDVNGDWSVTSIVNVPNFSAIGYFYALELYKMLKVPIGIINLSWGGSNVQAWMSLENLKMFPQFNESQIDMNSKSPMRIPSALYNGMFYPIRNYNIKGIIWYQGESNIHEPELYLKMFPSMVKEWRSEIGLGNIPFYYVQIAPYEYNGSKNTTSALFREVQLKSESIIPNSQMIVSMDVGEENNIHPRNKIILSKRLTYSALANVYNYPTIPHYYPIFSSMVIDGNKIILTFENTGNGLISTSNELSGFEIVDSNNEYETANAKIIKGNQVEVWSNKVSNPKGVRYCFRNYQLGTLANSYGFPSSSFRTE